MDGSFLELVAGSLIRDRTENVQMVQIYVYVLSGYQLLAEENGSLKSFGDLRLCQLCGSVMVIIIITKLIYGCLHEAHPLLGMTSAFLEKSGPLSVLQTHTIQLISTTVAAVMAIRTAIAKGTAIGWYPGLFADSGEGSAVEPVLQIKLNIANR